MHANRAYDKGTEDAKKDLGLYPSEPPPTWAHGRKITVPSAIEKKAFLGSDHIPGGPADKKKPTDFDPKALRQGQQHEMEHTNSPGIAKEIASDHLTEMPDYYERILKLERK